MATIEMGGGEQSALAGVSILSFAEAQHVGRDSVAAKVFKELVGHYGFSKRAAATCELHAEQDEGHGARQIEAIARYATDDETQGKVRRAVKLGVTAFTLEWDGHVQAMTGKREFWSGTAPVKLDLPRVALPAR